MIARAFGPGSSVMIRGCSEAGQVVAGDQGHRRRRCRRVGSSCGRTRRCVDAAALPHSGTAVPRLSPGRSASTEGIRGDRAKLPPHGRIPCHVRHAVRRRRRVAGGVRRRRRDGARRARRVPSAPHRRRRDAFRRRRSPPSRRSTTTWWSGVFAEADGRRRRRRRRRRAPSASEDGRRRRGGSACDDPRSCRRPDLRALGRRRRGAWRGRTARTGSRRSARSRSRPI